MSVREPEAEGLAVIDASGVVLGNSDITCERGNAEPTGDVPFPVYPAPHQLPQLPRTHKGRKASE